MVLLTESKHVVRTILAAGGDESEGEKCHLTFHSVSRGGVAEVQRTSHVIRWINWFGLTRLIRGSRTEYRFPVAGLGFEPSYFRSMSEFVEPKAVARGQGGGGGTV